MLDHESSLSDPSLGRVADVVLKDRRRLMLIGRSAIPPHAVLMEKQKVAYDEFAQQIRKFELARVS